MKKRSLLAALLAGSMVFGMTACGGSAGTAATKAAATTKAASAAATTAATKAAAATTRAAGSSAAAGTTKAAGNATTKAAATGGKDITSWIKEKDTNISGTVRFWIPFKGTDGMDAMIADFNKTYPNIKVTLSTYNNNADGNLSVNTSAMSGQIDVLASFGLSNTYKRWQNDIFVDITDRVAKENISLVDNWGTDVYKYNGKTYTFPCGGLCNYIAINMNSWKKAGYTDLPKEWTWDEYLEASKKMTEKDASGAVTMFGGSDYHSVNYFTYPKYQVSGKDNYYNDDGTCSFDSDIVVNSLKREVKAELEDKIWFPKATYRSDNLQAQMTFLGTSKPTVASVVTPNVIRFIRDTKNYPVDFVTGFAPYPVEKKGQKNYMSGVPVFSHVGIVKGCADEKAAWAFTKWYATYGSKYLIIAGHQSTWKGTDSGDLVKLVFNTEDNAKKLIDVESFKRVVGAASNPAYVETNLTAYSDVGSTLNEYAMYVFNGQMQPEEAMKQAAQIANDAIKKEKK
jgi:multiple sugar transport system substrate-binding protein